MAGYQIKTDADLFKRSRSDICKCCKAVGRVTEYLSTAVDGILDTVLTQTYET